LGDSDGVRCVAFDCGHDLVLLFRTKFHFCSPKDPIV
jgi:hypothetical protein